MKYEYEESKRSKVEQFISENQDIQLSLRWFQMYEHMLYEDFGDQIIKAKRKDSNLSNFIKEKSIFFIYLF
jgi:hypothetical protein